MCVVGVVASVPFLQASPGELGIEPRELMKPINQLSQELGRRDLLAARQSWACDKRCWRLGVVLTGFIEQ